MDEIIVQSSIIQAYSYNPTSFELKVRFKSGSSWLYSPVYPAVVDQVFKESGSIGSKFHRLVKNSMYVRKLEKE